REWRTTLTWQFAFGRLTSASAAPRPRHLDRRRGRFNATLLPSDSMRMDVFVLVPPLPLVS
ncbi:hypothetical protein IW146_010499, partial [Coemansia sp. RSA 922]